MKSNSNAPINLKPHWFNRFPELVGLKPGPLFPVFEVNAPAAGKIITEMQQSGLCDQRGGVSDDLKGSIQTLVLSDRSCRVRFLCEDDLFEQHFFAAGQKTESVCLTRTGDGFKLEFPATDEDLLSMIGEFTGTGTFMAIDVTEKLSHAVALTLAACHDLIRKQMYLVMGGAQTWQSPILTAKQILQHLQSESLNSSSFVWVLQSMLSESLQFEMPAIEKAISVLSAKGWLKNFADGAAPEEKLLMLCRRMLVFESLLKVDVMHAGSDRVGIISTAAVHCGSRDILLVESDDESFRLSGISGRQLLLFLHEMISHPDILKPIDQVETEGNICSCGKQLTADAKFCKYCGKPRPTDITDTTAAFCSQCGKALKPGKKFCTACGAGCS